MKCPNCGWENATGAVTCVNCSANLSAQPPAAPQQPQQPQQPYGAAPVYGQMPYNTSGAGSTSVPPPEILGWNWGAFFLNWIWSIGNSVWIGLLCLVPCIGFVMIFVLGAKGSEWAWQNKRWESVEQFKATQRTWAIIGLVIFLISVVLNIIYVAVMIPMMAKAGHAGYTGGQF